MKKVIFISALAIAAAVSCTKSDIVDTKFDDAIGFEAYAGRDAQTKASVVDEAADLTDGLGLYGFYTGAGEWSVATSANLWANLKVNSNGTYDEQYKKYWTNDNDNYTFLAYAPYANATTNTAIVPGINTTDGPFVTYTVPTDLNAQKDLLYSDNNVNINKPTGENTAVNLEMQHALSRITVKASEAAGEFDYKIYGIKITGNFPKTNTLTLKGGVWGTAPATTEYVEYVIMPMETDDKGKITSTGVPVTATDTPHDFAGTNKDNYLMVIPTPEVEGAKTDITLEVVYTTIFDEKESTPMTKTLEISVDFNKATAYSFDLVFAPNTDNAITFSVSVEGWGDEVPVLDNTDDTETPRNDNPEDKPWA